MNLTNLLILTLATFRIAYLIAHEEFIFSLMFRLKKAVGVEYITVPYQTDDANGNIIEYYEVEQASVEQDNSILRGLNCVYCLSFWVGIAFYALYLIAPNAAIMAAIPLALSSGAILVKGVIE